MSLVYVSDRRGALDSLGEVGSNLEDIEGWIERGGGTRREEVALGLIRAMFEMLKLTTEEADGKGGKP